MIALGNLGGFTNGALIMAVGGYLPTYVQGAMGGSVLSAGLVLGASSMSWAFASFAAGRLMVRTSYRLVAVIGGLSLVAGSLLLVALEPGPQARLGRNRLLRDRDRNGVLQYRLRGFDPGQCWLDRARRGDFIIHVHAHRRPIGRRRGVWRGAQFRPPSRYAPETGDLVNRLLDPGLRHSLGAAELARLGDAIASSLHLVYIMAGLAAVVTLVLACALPAALSPTRPLAGGEVRWS